MSDTPGTGRTPRLRAPTLGEAIAIAALAISGLGLWHEWRKSADRPVVVEQPAPVPLVLRANDRDEGRVLEIQPVEDRHALQSLSVRIGGSTIELGSDGELEAEDVRRALGDDWAAGEGTRRVPVRITARYVEAGADKSATGAYVLSYRVRDKLIGGKSLRLEGLGR